MKQFFGLCKTKWSRKLELGSIRDDAHPRWSKFFTPFFNSFFLHFLTFDINLSFSKTFPILNSTFLQLHLVKWNHQNQNYRSSTPISYQLLPYFSPPLTTSHVGFATLKIRIKIKIEVEEEHRMCHLLNEANFSSLHPVVSDLNTSPSFLRLKL